MAAVKQSTTSPAIIGASFAFDHAKKDMADALGVPHDELDEINETARIAFMKNASHTTSEAVEQLVNAYNRGEFKNVDHLILAAVFTGMNIGRMTAPSMHSLLGMLGED